MNRTAWGIVGIVCGVGCLAVVWGTATAPILGSRLLNWTAIIGLAVVGSYCFRRANEGR